MRPSTVFFLLLVPVLALFSFAASAQFNANYKPLPVLDTIPKATSDLLHARLEAAKARVPDPRSKASVLAKELYEESYDYVIHNFNDDAFIAEGDVVEKLRAIVTRVSAANPALPKEIMLYVHRTGIPNAATMSGGTIAVTLGLLTKLQTEDQLAFALCHEMAHHYRRHQETRLLELARMNYDKDLRRQMRSITRSEYGVITKASGLGLRLGMSIMQHSRDKEYEADSLGLQLYLNTGYSPGEAIRLLEVLDSIDYEQQKTIDIKKHFTFAAYPFKDKWLSYDTTADSFVRANHTISDTLLTHPDCRKRIAALQRQLKVQGGTSKPATEWPIGLRKAGTFELVSSAFHYGQYSLATFRALSLLEEYPENAWLHGIVGMSIYNVYRLQKAHQVGRALPLPAPYFDANYNKFLAFLHNLRLMEIASIAYHYTSSRKQAYAADEEFLYARWLCSQSEIGTHETTTVSAEYRAAFPGGKYEKEMTNKH